MDMVQSNFYTEEDYYNTPENVRCELINGNLIYAQATPTRIHQKIPECKALRREGSWAT